jgi:EAL domain-containing protein (putative c-di-GMP-specific phosphodiesterase class I)
MYVAKSASGGHRMFAPDMAATTAESLSLASDLRDAVEADQIDVALQPLVDFRTGALHSVEVLARWRHPDLGDIAPAVLFEAAERSSQVAALSDRILDRALALARRWQDDGRPVRVAVNLAPRWLADAGLPRQIAAALDRHGVPADLLCLEIREASVLADPRRRLELLGRLREMGVHLAVDDFGTGYSSLTYLSRLPVDQLKIDASFVGRLTGSAQDRAVGRTIVSLGRGLGLEVVGEGVTDEATRDALVEIGCGLGQGYLFAQPLTPEAFAEFVREREGVVMAASAAPPAPRRPSEPPQ